MTAGGSVCVMGTALGTMPSTGGGRPPAGKLTTPGGYLKTRREVNHHNILYQSFNSVDGVGGQCFDVVCMEIDGQ